MSVKLDDALVRQAEVAVVDHEYECRGEGTLRSHLLAAGNVFCRIEMFPGIAGIETPRPGAIAIIAIWGDDNPNSLRLGTHGACEAHGTDAQSNSGCDSDLSHLLVSLRNASPGGRCAPDQLHAFSPHFRRCQAVFVPFSGRNLVQGSLNQAGTTRRRVPHGSTVSMPPADVSENGIPALASRCLRARNAAPSA